jgi:predicted dienelactone hydrolase
LAVVSALAVVTAGCGGSGGGRDDAGGSRATTTTPTTTTLGTGDGTFTMRTETFVDPSRPTGTTPGRTLPTDIYVPGGTGPFPLILHNHGMAGSSAKFTELLGAWARAGYVVVAPNFPLTNASVPQAQRSISDVANQPADATFVLDQVLAETAPGGKLAGKVSTGHMGVSGLSLGGATTYGLLFHPCCRDERFRSAVLMSAFELPLGTGDFDWTRRIPVLVFAGTADLAIPYARQQAVIAKLAGPTWSVTLEGGQHALPFENAASPHDAVVTATTLDFWAATLRDDPAAKARITTDATVPGLSSVTVTP